MSDLIERQAAIDALINYFAKWAEYTSWSQSVKNMVEVAQASVEEMLTDLPSAQPERNEIIQKFRDYQIEWLTSHCDIELEPELETWVVRFLCDTADCFDMEVEHEDN